MIKNIIFDIGNVLADYCWEDHIVRCGFSGEKKERLGRAMMLSDTWQEIDRGVWSEEQLLAGFIANDREMEAEIRTVFSDMSTLIRARSGSKDWLRSLKADGYRVYYLSNFSRKVEREAKKELSFLEEMDGGILSYTVRLIKPDPAIYRLLLERYGLSAEESVFLDDSAANVQAAKALGMEGILVTSQEQAGRELDSLLKGRKRE